MNRPGTTHPQPWEGMRGTGTTRTDGLLSLEENAIAHREIITATVMCLGRAVNVGHPAPIVQRMGERLRTPRPGDLVVYPEITANRRRDLATRLKAFGVLLAQRDEWLHTDDEWLSEDADDPYGSSFAQWTAGTPRVYDPLRHPARPVESRVYYVQYGPNPDDICRWTDAAFTTVPTWLTYDVPD
jgi:hypothetical protein